MDMDIAMSVGQRFRQVHSAGFSLIEVLVSVVILTIGLLGMVGMQAGALQANREARLQSTAVGLARELADMMRGNKETGLKVDEDDNPYRGEFVIPAAPAAPTLALADPDYCLNVGSSCDGVNGAKKVAAAQMTEWLPRVSDLLPGARVTVCLDTTPFDANGLPNKWSEGCTFTPGEDAMTVIKIGWTRRSTELGTLDRADEDARPGVVIPVTAGFEE